MRTAATRIELRCILFCDIVHSTPQSVHARQQGREADLNARVARFMELWKDALAECSVCFVKSLGDGFMATSTDPVGLARAVVRARRAVDDDPTADGLPTRVGLHVGAVSVQPDGDILGADAALGERVMKEARAGQVFASEAFTSQVRPYLPAGFVLREVGERMLMGFDTPMRLYQLVAPGLPDPAAVPDPEPERRAPVRILLVEDETLLRNALASLLKLEPDFEMVGLAANGAVAVAEARSQQPDVVLMDIQMPQMNGIEATRRIVEACPATKVLILTKFGDDDNVFAAISAGAIGYMLKDAGVDEIVPVVRAAARGEGFISPALVPRVTHEFARLTHAGEEARALFAELSRREVEVLEMLGQGLRNRVIADKLFISEKTVKNHVSNILAKLQLNDRTQAALLARDHGLAPR